MPKRKTFAPAIALLLALSILVSGCTKADWFQPDRSEIVGANLSLLDGPLELDIRLDMVPSDTLVLYYDTVALAQGEKARWEGAATAKFGDVFFRQECDTLCDATGSAKLWREEWVASDTRSPVPTIKEWLERARTKGTYYTRPVIPEEEADILKGLTEEAYRIVLSEKELDWKALCDIHLNSLFGGEETFNQFKDINVTLYFGTEDMLLDGILLSVDGSDGRWFNMAICPVAAQAGSDVDVSSMPLSQGNLAEEWSILSTGTEDGKN